MQTTTDTNTATHSAEFRASLISEDTGEKIDFDALSTKKKIHLLTAWADECRENYGPDSEGEAWAAEEIQLLEAAREKKKNEKALIIVAPPAEESPEEPVTEDTTSAKTIDVEVVIEPKVERGDMGFHAISEFLSVTCQKVVSKDVASVVHDAQQGRMALPPLFFSGFAGLGKTYTLSLISKHLPNHELIELPPGFNLTTLKLALVRYYDKPFILFIDEFHDMEAGVRNFLKALTETNGKPKDFRVSIGKDDFSFTIDPRKHWFIGASNEPIKDSALVGQSGRFRDCQFLPYDDNGKKSILTALAGQYLPSVELSTQTKSVIARNCRPFARSLKMMLERLWTEKKHGADLTTEDGVKKAIAAAGYFPEGWRKEHTDVLTFLAATKEGRQVQEIAAGPMRGASTKQASALLAELMQGDLIMTLGNGRKAATNAAVKLLKKLEKKS